MLPIHCHCRIQQYKHTKLSFHPIYSKNEDQFLIHFKVDIYYKKKFKRRFDNVWQWNFKDASCLGSLRYLGEEKEGEKKLYILCNTQIRLSACPFCVIFRLYFKKFHFYRVYGIARICFLVMTTMSKLFVKIFFWSSKFKQQHSKMKAMKLQGVFVTTHNSYCSLLFPCIHTTCAQNRL